MGIFANGNGFDASVNLTGTVSIVNGINVGESGVAFTIPTNFDKVTKTFSVVASTAGTVTVSGISPQTINGATSALSVTYLTGKTFYNNSGTNWISY